MDYFNKYKRPIFIGLFIGFAVLVIILIIADVRAVAQIFADIDLRFVPLIVLMAPLNYLLRFIKWNYYLKISGIRPEPRMNRYIFVSGLSMTITPGKVGELLKCYLMKEHIDAPISKTSSIVMAERVTDAMAMVVLALLGFLAFPHGKIVVAVTTAILLMVLVIIQSDYLFNLFFNQVIKMRLLKKSASFLRNFQVSAKTLFSTRHLVFAVGISVISWGFEGLVVYLAIIALGGEMSILGSFFIVSFSSLLGVLSFLPGGVGVAEGSILTILIFTGIRTDIAAATTVITRISTLWLGVALGIVGLILTNQELIKQKNKN